VGMYYAETSIGCSIIAAANINSARSQCQREIGTLQSIKLVRPALKKDIDWVRMMGGHIPEPYFRSKKGSV